MNHKAILVSRADLPSVRLPVPVITARAGKIFPRIEFVKITEQAFCSVNSTTRQVAHFDQTIRF